MPPTMRFEPPPVYPTPPVASPRGGGGGGAMVMLLVAAVLAIGGLAVWKIGEHSRSDPSPSPSVTASESPSPTVAATGGPTGMPTTMPTGGPGGMPTGGPGDMPSGGPGGYPTSGPGGIPTDLPTVPGAQTSVMLDQVVMCDAVTGTGAPVNTVQAYGPRQNFYVSMKAFNLRVGTWIVGAFRGPGFTRDLKLDSNRQGNYYCWFKVEPPAGAWVPGTYQAFIVVDGTLKNTLTFQVTP